MVGKTPIQPDTSMGIQWSSLEQYSPPSLRQVLPLKAAKSQTPQYKPPGQQEDHLNHPLPLRSNYGSQRKLFNRNVLKTGQFL